MAAAAQGVVPLLCTSTWVPSNNTTLKPTI